MTLIPWPSVSSWRARAAHLSIALAAVALVVPPAVLAQDEPATDEPPTFAFQPGPFQAELGDIAQIEVPEGFVFLDGGDTSRLMEAMGNLTDGSEKGSVYPASDDENWFIVFEFSDVGYVKDEDKDALDAGELLASIREGNEAGNEERQRRGLPTLELVGWEHPPNYDSETQNLQWCLRFLSEGEPILNYNTRLLGRRGVMSATLVAGPEELATVLPIAKSLLGGYEFQEGQRYAEFRSGDKIAEYGLKGLVLGGAAAVALKSGLLQKLWKLIVLGVVAAAAFVRRLFHRIMGRDTAVAGS